LAKARYRPMPPGAELLQPAWLEPRRNEYGVGASLHQMGEVFVMAENASDLSRIVGRGRGEALFEFGIAGPEYGELRATREERGCRSSQQIEPLLPGHPADHGKQQPLAILIQIEPALERGLVRPARR